MTKQAIREGFEKLSPGTQMQSLEEAARSRSGGRLARRHERDEEPRPFVVVAWVGGVVSLGRVQTPTLGLIVRREREIQAFVPEPYRLIHSDLQPPYQGLWFEGDETRIFGDLARADNIVAKVLGRDGTVEKVERKEQSERRPLLYDLTSLQRDANRRYGSPPGDAAGSRSRCTKGRRRSRNPRTFLPLPLRRHGPAVEADRRTLQPIEDYRKRRRVRARARPVAARACHQRREGRRSPRDHIPPTSTRTWRRCRQTSAVFFDLIAKRFLGGLPIRRRGTPRTTRESRSSRTSASARAQDHPRGAGGAAVYGL